MQRFSLPRSLKLCARTEFAHSAGQWMQNKPMDAKWETSTDGIVSGASNSGALMLTTVFMYIPSQPILAFYGGG